MTRSWAAVVVLVFANTASAHCQLADTLVDAYGISFSGFTKPLPKVSEHAREQMAGQALLLLSLKNPRGSVADGFEHSALIDLKNDRAWIERRGGFIGVDEWYGPVALVDYTVLGCDVARYIVPKPVIHRH